MSLKVDFTGLEAAVAKMGSGARKFDFRLDQVKLDPIDIALSKEGIEVELKDVSIETGLLSYKGRQVLLYIQDHGGDVKRALENGVNGRRFHVADCFALKSMRARGRFQRYVATNDLSGTFFINGTEYPSGKSLEGRAELKVCKYCLGEVNYRGYARGGNRYRIFEDFTLAEFFATYSSFFPHMPKRWAGERDALYTVDWPIISGQIKADKGFRCEQCGIDLGEHRQLLHVHHINGVKTDNAPGNLRVLCADCHQKQADHEHLFVPHEDMKLITRLRREQEIGGLPGCWQEAFELADTGVHGVLHACKAAGWGLPEVGYELQDQQGRIVAQLELAWPPQRKGVAIADEDIAAARRQRWQVWSMVEAVQHLAPAKSM